MPPTDDPLLTPLYDSLTMNLPHPVMAYTSYPFPPSTPLFPHARVVKHYLDDYADHFHLRAYIQLDTGVTQLKWDGSIWQVITSTGELLRFDLIFI